jgi:chromate transporter
MSSVPTQPDSIIHPSLLSIAIIFLRLGSTAFGGPAAHIALMEDELVSRRKWLSGEQFLDLIGAANLIPGPNSTEVALHVGHTQRGLSGLLVAGVCFILPAALMVISIAALYLRYGNLAVAAGVLYGLKPVIIAIVLRAVWNLARTALKSKFLIAASVVVTASYLLGVNQIALQFGAGLIASLIYFLQDKEHKEKAVLGCLALSCFGLTGFAVILVACTPKTLAYSPIALFLYFLKLGSVLYGSGYVLLAFLRSDLVEHYHWITSTQLLDAVAVGQITPGPLFTTATFVGYILGGTSGALVATVAIFLPAFVLVAVSGPVVRRMRTSKLAMQFMDAVNAAAIAFMSVVLFQLGQAALVDITSLLLALLSAVLLFRFRINSMWLMAGGAAIGLLKQQHLINI